MKVGILIGYFWPPLVRKNLNDNIKMLKFFRKHSVELSLISYNFYDAEKKCFTQYVDIEHTKIITKEYKPDVIWKRVEIWNYYTHHIIGKSYPIIPSENIFSLSGNKYESYLFFKKYQARTQLLTTFFSNTGVQESFANDVVLKPLRGSWWRQVEFMKKKDLLKNRENYEITKNTYIIQEYKDFTQWYPGLVSWNHDLRLCYISGKLSFAYMRESQDGSLLSNIHTGGKGYGITKTDIPKDLVYLTDEIIQSIGDITLFSLDFGYCLSENRWYLIELNAIPWTLGWWDTLDLWQQSYFTDLIHEFSRIKK